MNNGQAPSVGTGELLGELTPVIWQGRRYFRIPGPECKACDGTGWTVVHGAPRRGDGLPHMNGYCFVCHRDPQQFLHDRITALVAAKSSPNALDELHGRAPKASNNQSGPERPC